MIFPRRYNDLRTCVNGGAILGDETDGNDRSAGPVKLTETMLRAGSSTGRTHVN